LCSSHQGHNNDYGLSLLHVREERNQKEKFGGDFLFLSLLIMMQRLLGLINLEILYRVLDNDNGLVGNRGCRWEKSSGGSFGFRDRKKARVFL